MLFNSIWASSAFMICDCLGYSVRESGICAFTCYNFDLTVCCVIDIKLERWPQTVQSEERFLGLNPAEYT